MNLARTRLLFLVVLTLLLTFPTLAAGKRRAVRHPAVSANDVAGIVLDSVTGAPVATARVEVGNKRATTGEDGRFVLAGVISSGTVTLTVDRTGYVAQTLTVSSGDAQNLTIRLVPEPTASLRKTDGSVLQLDYDSLEFGYLSGFSDYVKSESEDFCFPSGEHRLVSRSEMKKLIGPAVRVTHSPCCTTSEVFRIKVELRNGTTTDVYFDDSCSGYPVDVIARNHATGQFVYVPLTDTAELQMPASPVEAARAVRSTKH